MIAFSFVYTEETPIIITGCPSNITRFVYQNEGEFVTWQEPSASGEGIGPPERSHIPGEDFFYVGNLTEVTYTFGNSSSCVFTVLVMEGKKIV